MRLEERVALIMGAGSEIGSAIARRFAREGALIAACESRFASAERVKDFIKKEKGKALAFEADALQRTQVETVVEKIIDKWGRIDILINDLGERRDAAFLNMDQEGWSEIVKTRLDGCFNTTQSISCHMAENQYGRIVNFSAERDVDIITRDERSNSLAANAAIEGMTQALARELGKHGITVNCVVPEFIETRMLRDGARAEGLYLEDLKKLAASLVPLRRLGKPEEVANLCLFLASEEASFISGQIIKVKGGP
ncbi:SDR family NAD(P)-dependent oxidoreductase [Thermodesulfobacteriota bacterium]